MSSTGSSRRMAASKPASELTPSQITIVKSTASHFKKHGEKIANLFYKNLLAEHPELHDFFTKSGQMEGTQARAIARTVFAYASYVDNLDQMAILIERISQKHTSLMIRPEHYEIAGGYLIEAIGIVLGPEEVTPDISAAWYAAYNTLAGMFINREKQIYSSHADWAGWRRFVVEARSPESAKGITTFDLAPEDAKDRPSALPSFQAGQYISIRIFVQSMGHMQPRQYPLQVVEGNDPPRFFRIAVKREVRDEIGVKGVISNMLVDRFKEGSTIEVTHPAGLVAPAPLAASQPQQQQPRLRMSPSEKTLTPSISTRGGDSGYESAGVTPVDTHDSRSREDMVAGPGLRKGFRNVFQSAR